MYLEMNEGIDVVRATKLDRQEEKVIKSVITKISYRVINGQSEVRIPRDTGDFGIMSRMVTDELVRLQENHGLTGGLVTFIGFNQVAIEYDRVKRYSKK